MAGLKEKKRTRTRDSTLIELQIALADLDVRVRALERCVERIEDKHNDYTWRIAKVVFIVLSCIVAIVGGIIAILNFLI